MVFRTFKFCIVDFLPTPSREYQEIQKRYHAVCQLCHIPARVQGLCMCLTPANPPATLGVASRLALIPGNEGNMLPRKIRYRDAHVIVVSSSDRDPVLLQDILVGK